MLIRKGDYVRDIVLDGYIVGYMKYSIRQTQEQLGQYRRPNPSNAVLAWQVLDCAGEYGINQFIEPLILKSTLQEARESISDHNFELADVFSKLTLSAIKRLVLSKPLRVTSYAAQLLNCLQSIE